MANINEKIIEVVAQISEPTLLSIDAGFTMLTMANKNENEQQKADGNDDANPLPASYNDGACPICLEPFDQQPTVVITCRHTFCLVCLDHWRIQNESYPVCCDGQQLTEDDHPIPPFDDDENEADDEFDYISDDDDHWDDATYHPRWQDMMHAYGLV